MQTNITKYVLEIPTEFLNKVRKISFERKNNNAPNKTQKAILNELLAIGLMMTEPSTQETSAQGTSQAKELDNPKQIKLV